MREIRLLRAMRRELETGLRHTPTRAQRGKPWIQTRSGLRVTAPVPDPTGSSGRAAHQRRTRSMDCV